MVKAEVGIHGLHLLSIDEMCQITDQGVQIRRQCQGQDELTGVMVVGSDGLGTHQGVPGTSIGPLATCVAEP